MTLICLASDELSPAVESTLLHRLLADGENPNNWMVLAVWASDGVYAVVLEGEARARAFTVARRLERTK
jgi:hypothetical protein